MILKELVQTRDEDSVIIYSNYLLQMKMNFFSSVKQKKSAFLKNTLGTFFNIMRTGAAMLQNEKPNKCIIKVVHASQAIFQVIYVNNTLKFESLFNRIFSSPIGTVMNQSKWFIHIIYKMCRNCIV